MAKFNEKVMCLFNKDYEQLKKEAKRRGMGHDGREKTIAKIIWKDAYDAGFIEGKNFTSAVKSEVKKYCLHDFNSAMKYRLELTEEQVSAIKWMIDHEFIIDVEFSEWDETFEDVGRI